MSTAMHPSTVTPAQLAQQLTPYGFGSDLGAMAGQLGQFGIGQLGAIAQPGQLGAIAQPGQVGAIGQLSQLGQLNQLGQFGQFGQLGQRTAAFGGAVPQIQPNPVALICEYLAVQQVATTIATNLIAALLPAALQNQLVR